MCQYPKFLWTLGIYGSQNSHIVHQAQPASKVCAGSILLLGEEIKVTHCSRADPIWSQAALPPPMELEVEPPQCSQLPRAGGDDSFGNFNIDVDAEDLLAEETRKWPVLQDFTSWFSPWTVAEGIPLTMYSVSWVKSECIRIRHNTN